MKKKRNWILKLVLWVFLLGICYTFKEYRIQLNYGLENEELFRETRSLLFSRIADIQPNQYDPRNFSKAINELQSLGREQVLSEIKSYISKQGKGKDNLGLILLMRALFILPDGTEYPELKIKNNYLQKPKSYVMPHFPMVIINNFPILLVPDLDGVLTWEFLNSQVEFYKENGILREKLMAKEQTAQEIISSLGNLWETAYQTEIPQEVISFIKKQTKPKSY